MMKNIIVLTSFLAATGCAQLGLPTHEYDRQSPAATDSTSSVEQTAVVAPPPPENARTAEQFDTTTDAERAAAAATPAAAGAVLLGETIASLGSPTDPGFWLKTPLVSEVTQGRITAENGNSAQVELRPSGGEASAGSEASLAALRLLDVPLTGLIPLDVEALQ